MLCKKLYSKQVFCRKGGKNPLWTLCWYTYKVAEYAHKLNSGQRDHNQFLERRSGGGKFKDFIFNDLSEVC